MAGIENQDKTQHCQDGSGTFESTLMGLTWPYDNHIL